MEAIEKCPPLAFVPNFSSKGDIDRIGNNFCDEPQSLPAIRNVQEYRKFRMHCLTTTLQVIEAAQMPECCLVSIRLKRLDKIREKIIRPDTNFTLGQMDDVIGVRVICSRLDDVYKFDDRIQSLQDFFYRQKNYLGSEHKDHTGYRGIHNIMHFKQPISVDKEINVRFEVQIRSYYQHQWAVWSESKGLAVKLGMGDDKIHSELQELSKRIATWELANVHEKQAELPEYSGNKEFFVAWCLSPNPVLTFASDAESAVQRLNYLEKRYQYDRHNALLLVGVSDPGEARNVLLKTHPSFTATRVIAPEYWMPKGA